ncbi:hypothetical protein FS842_009580 [Serendipita sp. 407]|nr:hypothetical protein FS842_009580 [Serendipita sp. 407]
MTPQKKFIGHEPSPDPLQQRRHPSLPPFMRSFSQHATVIRRVISRSRSRGTTMTESPVTDTDEKVLKVVGAGTGGTSGGGAGGGGENRVDSSKGKGKILRPALAHRITSGSADQEVSSVRNLESRVRTTSQPSPTRDANTSTHPDQGLGAKPPTSSNVGKVQGADASSRGLGVPGSSKGLGTSPPKTVFGGIKSVREGVGTKMTRIEEPPLSERRRRTTGAASDGDNEEVELRMRSQTTYVEARRLAKQIGASGYMECSALTLVNVVKVFDEAVRIAGECFPLHLLCPSSPVFASENS